VARDKKQEWFKPKQPAELYYPTAGLREKSDLFNWIRAVNRDLRMTEQTRRILTILYLYRNKKTGLCFPELETLAMMCGLPGDGGEGARVQVRRCIREGERHGWVKRHYRPGRDRNQSNLFEFLLPAAVTDEIPLTVTERDGAWYAAQATDGVEICGPFKTREGAETWVKDHGPGDLTEQIGDMTEQIEGLDRTALFGSNDLGNVYKKECSVLSTASLAPRDDAIQRANQGNQEAGHPASSSSEGGERPQGDFRGVSLRGTEGHPQTERPGPHDDAIYDLVGMGGRMTIAGVIAYARQECSGIYATDNEVAVAIRRMIRSGRFELEDGYLYPNDEG
jgi:hypothetical protein